MLQPKVRNPQSAVRSPNEKVRPWTLTLLFMPLLLNCAGITWAQDDVPVPSLEAGTLLTFHPICVHFATALTVFGLALDWAGSWRHQTQW